MVAGSFHYLGFIFDNNIIIDGLTMENNQYIISGLSKDTNSIFQAYNKLVESDYYNNPNLKEIRESKQYGNENKDLNYSFRLNANIPQKIKENGINEFFKVNFQTE
jgi:hypothetical protein